jgi:predicted dehydrogenase
LRPKGSTWRSNRDDGGGVVYDYACHAIDLINYVVSPVIGVSGVIRNPIFSRDVDDEVYCSLRLRCGASGSLAANWSDESHRKMSTKLSIWGENGSIHADRQECAVYLRKSHGQIDAGWSVFNTTELTGEVWYYLRGEEYSAQIDEFARRIDSSSPTHACDFRAALDTDRALAMINGDQRSPEVPGRTSTRGRFRSAIAALRGDRG